MQFIAHHERERLTASIAISTYVHMVIMTLYFKYMPCGSLQLDYKRMYVVYVVYYDKLLPVDMGGEESGE